MQQSLVPLLRCPVSQSPLAVKIIKQVEKQYAGETIIVIEEGILFAAEDWFYPVINSIPRLNVESFLDHEDFLKREMEDYQKRKQNILQKHGELVNYVVKKNKRTKESFAKEWSLYNYDKDKTWNADDAGMIARFLKETNESEAALKDKIIFDAGCGNGKLDLLLAPVCKAIIAMDFTNSMQEAYKRNNAAHVHFIQGDVQYPPVQHNYFDIVHCSGVLIHTNNTAHSFSCLQPTVKKGGKLSVWLYHPRKNIIHRIFNAIRKVTSKMPLNFQYYLYMVTLLPLSYCIKRLKGNKESFAEMKLSILDWFTPEFRWEHEHEEAAGWYKKSGYKNVQVTTTDTFGFNITGEKI
ncbi:MAG: class I SAM-dependent methyltransferase [Ferruginibacter sp.]|nr:class I SAM-dependent methyltransferase [Ferruginibacter sp.]